MEQVYVNVANGSKPKCINCMQVQFRCKWSKIDDHMYPRPNGIYNDTTS